MNGNNRKPGRDEQAYEALAGQLRALLDEAGEHDAANPAGEKKDMPLQASNRADSFEQLVQEQFARIATQLDNLGKRLDKVPTTPQRPEEVPGYAELKTVLHNLIEHLELAEGRTAEAIGDLREKLDDVARRTARALEMAESGGTGDMPETRAALQVLEQRIDVLNKRLEEMRASGEESARAYVDSCIGEVEKKIENLQSTAPDNEALAEMVRQQVARHADEQVRQAEERIAAMVVRLQGKLEDLAGGVMDVDRLRTDVEQLDAHVRQVQETLQGLSARVAEKADKIETQALRQQLDELAGQLQQAHAAAPADDTRLHALEEQVLNIRQLVEEALGEPLTLMGEKLAAHEEQIGKLLQHGGAPAIGEEHASRIAALEERIGQLQQALANHGEKAAAETGKEIEALRAGMADLEKFARDSDARTREMMQTVHDALAEVVQRLDTLENGQQRHQPRPQPQARDAAPSATQEAAPSAAEALLGEAAPETVAPEQAAQDNGAAVRASMPQDNLKDEVAQVVALMQGDGGSRDASTSGQPQAFQPGAEPAAALNVAPNATADASAISREPSPQVASQQEDFIAAARRAAMAASNTGTKATHGGARSSSGLLARLTGRKQQQERVDEPHIEAADNGMPSTARADKSASLLGGLANLRGGLKRKGEKAVNTARETAQVADDATASVANKADKAAKAATRKRLMLAGVVLLSAGTVLMSRQGGQDAQPTAPAGAPMVQDEAATHGAGGNEARKAPGQGGRDNGQPARPAKGTDSGKPPAGKKVSDATGALPLDPTRAATAVETASITGLASAPRIAGEQPAPQAERQLPDSIGPAALRAAAASGNGKAAYVIATNYLRGRGVAPDAAKAVQWFRRAADKGVVVAMYRLGVLHERGIGTSRDMLKARVWYERAAQRGNVRAMHNLAVLLASGKAGEPDFEKAAQWFRKAAEQGVRDSQFNLAVLYHRGQGVQQSLADAWFWYEAAARQGDATAAEQAKKLAAYLPKNQLAEARKRLDAFTPTPPIRNANTVVIDRPEWRSTPAASRAAAARPATDDGKPLTGKALVSEVQRLLKRAGYDIGKVDGIMGNRTANAIRLFQLQARMKVTGTPSMELLNHLRQRLGGARSQNL